MMALTVTDLTTPVTAAATAGTGAGITGIAKTVRQAVGADAITAGNILNRNAGAVATAAAPVAAKISMLPVGGARATTLGVAAPNAAAAASDVNAVNSAVGDMRWYFNPWVIAGGLGTLGLLFAMARGRNK